MTNITSDSDGRARLRAEAIVIEEAMREAVHEAVTGRTCRSGLPMVVWQDGQVVWIPADQLPSGADNVTQ